MNRFLKSNSPWLGLVGLALIIVTIAYVFRPKNPEYQTGVTETMRLMDDPSNQVTISQITGQQLIDIRPANLFVQGHPANAINIPLRQLLDKESITLLKTLQRNGQKAVLYGSDELQATAPWFLLRQLGYENIKRLKGGYSSDELRESATASREEPIFDQAALQVKPELNQATENKPEKQNKELVIPVRKAASSGGGC